MSTRSYPIRGCSSQKATWAPLELEARSASAGEEAACRWKGCRKVRSLTQGWGWQVSLPHPQLTFLAELELASVTARLSFLTFSLPVPLEAPRRAVPIPTSIWRQKDVPPAALEPRVLSHHGSIAHPSLPNLSAGRSLHFSHQHAQRRRQLPSAIIRPHLTPPSTASCWCN